MYHAKIQLLRIVVVVGLLATSAVNASPVLTLSDLSSDETSPEDLDATLAFDVLGDRLILLVTNDTVGEDGFDISEIYFNSLVDEMDLILSPPVMGWNLLRDQRADGFGTFDFALLSDLGNDPAEIIPGESLSFVFDVSAIDPVTAVNFASDLSEIPPGEHPVVAAAKFVNGPGDDSAFGAVIPEPGTVLLVLLGCGFAISFAKRKSNRSE
jgi:hypothetical protein